MFDLNQLPGRPFKGEFIVATDGSAPANEPLARFTLYEVPPIALGAGITLAATEVVIITDAEVSFSAASAITTEIFDSAGTDDTTVDAGELIFVCRGTATLATHSMAFRTPHFCKPGTYPKAKSSGAGAWKAIIRGLIWSPPSR